MDDKRNPMIIPDPPQEARRRGCPKCSSLKYDGFMSYGVATFTCKECGNRWQGGIGVMPQDPTVPHPPINPKDMPNVDFVKNKAGQVEEIRRRPDLTQSYRQGARVPNPGEEDV